jgi:molybdopterin-containing oxidoreductase family iron-sulfur binding subunit
MFNVYSNDSNYSKCKKEKEEKCWEFQTACSNACSNGAMTLEINVKESPIAKLVADDRMYYLEHVGTKPMWFITKVRNT